MFKTGLSNLLPGLKSKSSTNGHNFINGSISSIFKGSVSSISSSSNNNSIIFPSSYSSKRSLATVSRNSNVPVKKSMQNTVLWKLYGTFNRHNTLLTFVAVVDDPNFLNKNPNLPYTEQVLHYLQLPHHPQIHVSAGQLGFKKSQRSEYEAGYQVSSRMFKLIEEQNLLNNNLKVELVLKNYGKGREAFLNALQGKEGSYLKNHIIRISDATKLKFGGTRSKKLRRL
ncbi:37S ribosomal protein S18, mitochondrial [[Candida] jaroonii]|uniref:37S ribosomal protein S18, mitochondrial n=1 Tax=[Candida] jaroonii TaxID=467808 RepID=A0ACA9YBN1_9ASCO|nr:37S ribosomal protein S18, mitochondrial [[Candida] jaroonii]